MAGRTLVSVLKSEQEHGIKGGIYGRLQVDFAYNSNHMEGSTLSHEQTQYIYDTRTVGIEPTKVDDIFEAVNHFRCFDSILEHMEDPLTGEYIKHLHKTLKEGLFDSHLSEAVIGDYKKFPNTVGMMETTSPEQVPAEMKRLLEEYNCKPDHTLDDILDFHASYEKIHPFYDGNGRTGRLIMFKECLHNNIVPFIITDQYKGYYYRGLKEWQTGGERGYLRDTCLSMQDNMKGMLEYYRIEYSGEHLKI